MLKGLCRLLSSRYRNRVVADDDDDDDYNIQCTQQLVQQDGHYVDGDPAE